jgi:hypothetical protein
MTDKKPYHELILTFSGRNSDFKDYLDEVYHRAVLLRFRKLSALKQHLTVRYTHGTHRHTQQ